MFGSQSQGVGLLTSMNDSEETGEFVAKVKMPSILSLNMNILDKIFIVIYFYKA